MCSRLQFCSSSMQTYSPDRLHMHAFFPRSFEFSHTFVIETIKWRCMLRIMCKKGNFPMGYNLYICVSHRFALNISNEIDSESARIVYSIRKALEIYVYFKENIENKRKWELERTTSDGGEEKRNGEIDKNKNVAKFHLRRDHAYTSPIGHKQTKTFQLPS